MEENKNVSNLPDTNPLGESITADVIPSVTSGKLPSNKNTLKIIISITIIATIVIVALIISTITNGVRSVASDCDAKAATINETDARLKSELRSIVIGGQAAEISDNYVNTDCLTGSTDIPVSAVYKYTAPNVAAANDTLKKALQSTTTPTFTPNSGSTLSELNTVMKSPNGKNYSVTYRLTTPINCTTNGQAIPCDPMTAVAQYNLLSQPINSVILTIWGSGNTY